MNTSFHILLMSQLVVNFNHNKGCGIESGLVGCLCEHNWPVFEEDDIVHCISPMGWMVPVRLGALREEQD